MVLDAVSNFVRGTADAAIASGDTTISVADASIFPDPATDGEFNVVIWDASNFPRPDQDADVEIMRVTARDTGTNELTVTRAQEMTSAAAHPNGSAIHLSPTAKMFSDIESTFADFWDAGAQELTADVNNTNTTTQALEAVDLESESATIGEGTEDPSEFGGHATFLRGYSAPNQIARYRLDNDATGALDVPHDDPTDIPWPDQDVDQIGSFDADNERWSPDEDGTYLFMVDVCNDGLNGSDAEVVVFIAPALGLLPRLERTYGSWVDNGNRDSVTGTLVVDLQESDEVNVQVRHRSGETEQLDGRQTNLQIAKLG